MLEYALSQAFIMGTNMKYYSIGQVAKMTALSAHTLRYYEKETLLSVERKSNGIRMFSENDVEVLHIITCLKETGMSIADIKAYFALCHSGKNDLKNREIRKKLFEQQKEKLTQKISQLQGHLETVTYKIWYYENLESLGDENDPNNCGQMREIYQRTQENAKK